MASPGRSRLAGTKERESALPQRIWSKAAKVMMDQQNFEAVRPGSADPAVALAQALGQLPKTPAAKAPGLGIIAKSSVESLVRELGLKLGDQNELTIRRIKRGKSYSFVRANGTRVRHAGTIRRLHSMAVPPAGCNTAITPTGRRSASTARRIGWRGWSRRYRRSAVTSRSTSRATRQ